MLVLRESPPLCRHPAFTAEQCCSARCRNETLSRTIVRSCKLFGFASGLLFFIPLGFPPGKVGSVGESGFVFRGCQDKSQRSSLPD
ncbi:hypothetical protein CEXT_101221 [Caerostris extrusa]|uniref:Uncharacterized protein n=1 Tax=Caerostris extrusa TaxID=172846 RepID=A0AAV4U263_CAEEX|nr:hypothetical protein CEXT_101221 [Caerostris extrusa]